jgi:hypothetical protein
MNHQYQKLYAPKIVHHKLKDLPSDFQLVEIYCGYMIYKKDSTYFAMSKGGVMVDVKNGFVLTYSRSTLSGIRAFLDVLSKDDVLKLKIHLLKCGAGATKPIKELAGHKLFNLHSSQEYTISTNVKKHIAEEIGLTTMELNSIIDGDVILGWILVQ